MVHTYVRTYHDAKTIKCRGLLLSRIISSNLHTYVHNLLISSLSDIIPMQIVGPNKIDNDDSIKTIVYHLIPFALVNVSFCKEEDEYIQITLLICPCIRSCFHDLLDGVW